MVMFMQAFRYAYEPFVFSKYRDSDNRGVYAVAMKYFIIFSLLIFTGTVFYLDLLKHVVKEAYYAGLVVVPLVMLGELFFGIYYNLSVWYKLTDRTQWGVGFSLAGCAVTLIIITGFVPHYGFIACAWASFASNLLMMLLSYFTGQRKFPVNYDLRSALTYALIAAACYVAGMMPQIDSLFLRLAYRSLILSVFIGIVIKREFPHGRLRTFL
ncbi:MAG: polysaccharide biosynthesis C-terminal domain-containing protein, partial [Tannerella sp.]|jgi:O-antigen/teichoic acid export membrane protein|nr:polysaccharide biosynthesis C-terminal domain-containing protein [Tannerella sp.]